MGGGEGYYRTSLQKLARVGIEDFGVSPHFVNGPTETITLPYSGSGEHSVREVMKDVERSDRLSLDFPALYVINFFHLERRDVSVLRQTCRHLPDRAPPVRSRGCHLDARRRDNQIRRPNLPFRRVSERERGWHIGWI